MSKYDKWATEDLGDYLSDYHKDTYGFRYRGAYDRASFIAELERIDAYHTTMKATFAGRETLRCEGWYIEETEPELIQQALWLLQEREREIA